MIITGLRRQMYPSKSVILDLAERDGPADYNSFSPFTGLKKELESQFSGTQWQRFSLTEFVNWVSTDFDPSKVRAREVENGLVLASVRMAGWVHLEDISNTGDETLVLKYFVSQCIGFKGSDSSPYKRRGRIQFHGAMDDGEGGVTLIKDIAKKEISYSDLSYRDNLNKIPFYMKAIWTYSIMYQSNLFGFIYAWIYLTHEKFGICKQFLSPQDFFSVNIPFFKLKPYTGEIARQWYITDNKDVNKFKPVLDIFRYPTSHKTEMAIIKSFAELFVNLGCNPKKEDVTLIDAEFMRKLRCHYLPTTKEYISYFSDLDVEVNFALQSANVFSVKKKDIYTDTNLRIDVNIEQSFLGHVGDKLLIMYNMARRMATSYNPDRNDICVKLMNHSPEEVYKLVQLLFKRYVGCFSLEEVKSLVSLDKGAFVILKSDNEPLQMNGYKLGKFPYADNYEYFISSYGMLIAYYGMGDTTYILPYEKAMECLDADESINRILPWQPI